MALKLLRHSLKIPFKQWGWNWIRKRRSSKWGRGTQGVRCTRWTGSCSTTWSLLEECTSVVPDKNLMTHARTSSTETQLPTPEPTNSLEPKLAVIKSTPALSRKNGHNPWCTDQSSSLMTYGLFLRWRYRKALGRWCSLTEGCRGWCWTPLTMALDLTLIYFVFRCLKEMARTNVTILRKLEEAARWVDLSRLIGECFRSRLWVWSNQINLNAWLMGSNRTRSAWMYLS